MEPQDLSAKHLDADLAPMHTAEHVINRTMDRLYHCGRSVAAHVERKKSKLDFALPRPLSDEEVRALEAEVNQVLAADLPVTTLYVTREEAQQYDVNLSRLPEETNDDRLRIVRIGDYDDCLCIGMHVESTRACGQVRITTHSYEEGRWRMRFKLDLPH